MKKRMHDSKQTPFAPAEIKKVRDLLVKGVGFFYKKLFKPNFTIFEKQQCIVTCESIIYTGAQKDQPKLAIASLLSGDKAPFDTERLEKEYKIVSHDYRHAFSGNCNKKVRLEASRKVLLRYIEVILGRMMEIPLTPNDKNDLAREFWFECLIAKDVIPILPPPPPASSSSPSYF